jgi:hypothetical protein
MKWRGLSPLSSLSKSPRADNLCLTAKQLTFTKIEAARIVQLLKEETTSMSAFFASGKYRCKISENGFVLRARVRGGIPPVIHGAFDDKDDSRVLKLSGHRSSFNKYFPIIWFSCLILFVVFALCKFELRLHDIAGLLFHSLFMFAMGALVTYWIRKQDLMSVDELEDFLHNLFNRARSV